MPVTPADEAGVLFIFEQKVDYGTKQTLPNRRRSDASSLNEASEKSLKLPVCPSVLHYRWITRFRRKLMRTLLITLTALGAVAVALPAVSAKRGLFHVI
jgi:hypothetical protein